MNIFCFGLSHQTAAVDVLERFVIPESALPEALVRLKSMPGLTEGLIVSTCNRTEFYVTGDFRDTPAPAFFESFYRDFRAGDETHLFRLWANHCVRHLFRVASGLESMVVGETKPAIRPQKLSGLAERKKFLSPIALSSERKLWRQLADEQFILRIGSKSFATWIYWSVRRLRRTRSSPWTS